MLHFEAQSIEGTCENSTGHHQQLLEKLSRGPLFQSSHRCLTSKEEKETRLLGTNFQQNKNDRMQQNLELYPFVKKRSIKTLISPLTRKRISEPLEKERLRSEKRTK